MSDEKKRPEPREWEVVLDDVGDKLNEDLASGALGRRVVGYIREVVLQFFETEFKAMAERMDADEDRISELEEEKETQLTVECEDVERALVIGGLLSHRFEAHDAARFLSEVADLLRGASRELAEKLDEVARVIGRC